MAERMNRDEYLRFLASGKPGHEGEPLPRGEKVHVVHDTKEGTVTFSSLEPGRIYPVGKIAKGRYGSIGKLQGRAW